MKKPTNTINQAKLCQKVAVKLNYSINFRHIYDVVSLFTDEFMIELRAKSRIDIPNFCSFRIESTKPRKFHHIQKRTLEISRGRRLLNVKLSYKLRDLIIQNLDLKKTFM